MKQKLRLLVPAIALVLSIFPLSSAEAAVTAGASCKTSGQVVVVKGAQFKCVKKGKKLTWSKFTLRTPATSKPSPSASSSPKKVVPKEALVVQALFEEIWKS